MHKLGKWCQNCDQMTKIDLCTTVCKTFQEMTIHACQSMPVKLLRNSLSLDTVLINS